jgi:hypothetical protein
MPYGLSLIACAKFGMETKSAHEPFSKAEARIEIPSSQLGGIRVEAEDVLPPTATVPDTAWDDIAPGNCAANNWYEP